MSLDEFRGAGWAFNELMKRAKADIERGEAKPAKVLPERPDARKIHIAPLAAKVLRRTVGWRGGKS